jgi:hypothetical protein
MFVCCVARPLVLAGAGSASRSAVPEVVGAAASSSSLALTGMQLFVVSFIGSVAVVAAVVVVVVRHNRARQRAHKRVCVCAVCGRVHCLPALL